MASAQPIDFTPMMGPVAQRLLGSPNQRLSRGARLRFGTNGSVEVDTAEGWFDDHEAKVRGGVLDLIRHKRGGDNASAFRWMEEEGLKERQSSTDGIPVIRSGARIFYDYADETGTVLFRVERRGKDTVPPFLQHGPDGNGGFHAARGCMQGVRRVPYRLPELLAAPADAIVFICEGEKDVDNLRARGFVATTNSGGAGKFTTELAASLAGRTVVALQDNDDAGVNHVAGVLAAVEGVAGKAISLLLPNLPAKGDVSDWLKLWGPDATIELERLATEALTEPPAQIETFPFADLAAWAATAPEPKRFVMAGFIPEHEVTLFTGSGGTNKSTMGLQLCACSAAGLPLLGVPVQPVSSLYVTAEDDDRENHWRLRKIGDAIGAPLAHLIGRLHVVSLRGRLGNELATFDHEGRLHTAPAFTLLRATIQATGSKLVVLDNVGHLYVGNENDRGQVTGFINLLYQLCRELGVTIVLVAHPNKQFLQGKQEGNATSGSTAWLNAVRSQLLIQRPEGNPDPDARLLTLGKANYARPDQQLAFRWHDFALVREDDLPADKRAELASVVEAGAENEAFMRCLAKSSENRRNVSHVPGTNYAPKIFAGMIEGRNVREKAFAAAMERLIHIGQIKLDQPLWQDTSRHWKKGIQVVKSCGNPPAATPCDDLRQPPASDVEFQAEISGDPACGTPPYTTYTGAPFGAAAPDQSSWKDNPALGRARMILAPGETGDEPIPGMEDWT